MLEVQESCAIAKMTAQCADKSKHSNSKHNKLNRIFIEHHTARVCLTITMGVGVRSLYSLPKIYPCSSLLCQCLHQQNPSVTLMVMVTIKCRETGQH